MDSRRIGSTKRVLYVFDWYGVRHIIHVRKDQGVYCRTISGCNLKSDDHEVFEYEKFCKLSVFEEFCTYIEMIGHFRKTSQTVMIVHAGGGKRSQPGPHALYYKLYGPDDNYLERMQWMLDG